VVIGSHVNGWVRFFFFLAEDQLAVPGVDWLGSPMVTSEGPKDRDAPGKTELEPELLRRLATLPEGDEARRFWPAMAGTCDLLEWWWSGRGLAAKARADVMAGGAIMVVAAGVSVAAEVVVSIGGTAMAFGGGGMNVGAGSNRETGAWEVGEWKDVVWDVMMGSSWRGGSGTVLDDSANPSLDAGSNMWVACEACRSGHTISARTVLVRMPLV
jgi:hypothetical protein